MSGLLIPNEYYKVYCNTLNAINIEAENVIIENLAVNNLVVNTETVNTITVNTDLIANQLTANRPVYTSSLKRLISFDTPFFYASSDSFNFTGGQKIIPFVNSPSNLFTNSGAPNYYISPQVAGIYKFDIVANLVSILDDADPNALPSPIYILLVKLLDASDMVTINTATDSTKFLLTNSITLEQYPATLNGTGLFSIPLGYKIQILLDPDSAPLNVSIDSLFCRVVITFIAPL